MTFEHGLASEEQPNRWGNLRQKYDGRGDAVNAPRPGQHLDRRSRLA